MFRGQFRWAQCARMVLEYRRAKRYRLYRICQRRDQRPIQPKGTCAHHAVYGQQLRMLQLSALCLAVICVGIPYGANWSNEILTLLSFALTAGYAVGDEVLWWRLEKFVRAYTDEHEQGRKTV